MLYLKGTYYLIRNLIISLSLAIFLIAIFMAYIFRSFKIIIISLIPNLLPLIITAGVMGFSGIPLKPSTILVFSIAFGISVDDTIHFLAKYRQELIFNKWKIKTAVYIALRETAVSMFYSSVILFFGFAVFMSSNFGGTVALGGLVSVTLLFAMLANLILLPSLLISLEDSDNIEKVIRVPKINFLSDKDRKKS
jgi:predicted RND superfamily exporter protein